MKKTLLLILSVMAFASMSVAQDVYTAGYYLNSYGKTTAAVYKNGQLLHRTNDSENKDHLSLDVLYFGDDVYWVDNCYDNGSYEYGDVFKNDTRYLSNPLDSESCIKVLFTDGWDVYAAGVMLIDGVSKPVVWKNDNSTPCLAFDNNGLDAAIMDAVMMDGIVYACGYTRYPITGIVWIEGEGKAYDFGPNSQALALAVYDDDVYTLVVSSDGTKVYLNSSVLYTLPIGDAYSHGSISIDAGDVYVTIDESSSNKSMVWKNGTLLQEFPAVWDLIVEANSNGVFCSGQDNSAYPEQHGRVWNDGNLLYTLESCDGLYGMFVDHDCYNAPQITLPYFEGFENDQTDWACWIQADIDEHNGTAPSYWERSGTSEFYSRVQPATGDYCARHRYNRDHEQFGGLISPAIQLPDNGTITMTFKTYEQFPGDYYYEGVMVIPAGELKGTNDLTGWNEIWTQNNPQNTWTTVSIDLSDYLGQEIALCFKYEGLNAHSWYIDDISITCNVGVDEADNESLAVYPNPACESVSIQGLEAETEVFIYNALGELVKTANVKANQKISISDLSDGFYLMRCGNTTLRFVKAN